MERQFLLGLGAFALLTAAVGLVSATSCAKGGDERHSLPFARTSLRLAAATPAARQDVDYARLDARLRQLMARPAMVGLAVGVVENGRITFLEGYGETLAGSGEKVTPHTVFRWASVSKGVAATMVAKLAEQHRLDLAAPVATYSASLKLPGGAEHRATVGDLLSHRLGLYRNAYDNKLEEGQDSTYLRRTLGQLNPVCPPGSCWSYQNVAYDAASEIVSKVTGLSYEKALAKNLFDPLGMTSASISREGLMSSPSWARPHDAGRRPLEVNDNYYRVPAAGGVNSSIKDLALWMVAQMGEMPDVLSPQLLAMIHAPLVSTPGERGRMRKFAERVHHPHYGYGWRSYDYAGKRIVGHRGGVAGYRSLILFDPARKSGVVALWNSNTSQPGGLEFEVMDMIHHLPVRDWLEIDRGARPSAPPGEAPAVAPAIPPASAAAVASRPADRSAPAGTRS